LKNAHQQAKDLNSAVAAYPAMRLSQINYLYKIAMSGPAGMPLSEFEDEHKTSATVKSRKISTLLNHNPPLVWLRTPREDRRERYIHLTREGQKLLDKLFKGDVDMDFK
jgi:DNA-binding MarR family transcriptional regulator